MSGKNTGLTNVILLPAHNKEEKKQTFIEHPLNTDQYITGFKSKFAVNPYCFSALVFEVRLQVRTQAQREGSALIKWLGKLVRALKCVPFLLQRTGVERAHTRYMLVEWMNEWNEEWMNEWMKSGRDGLSHFRTGKGARNEGRNCPVNEGGDELGVEGHPEFCNHSPLESGWRNRRALGFTEGDLGQVTPMGKEKTGLSSICRPSLGHTDGGPQGLPWCLAICWPPQSS